MAGTMILDDIKVMTANPVTLAALDACREGHQTRRDVNPWMEAYTACMADLAIAPEANEWLLAKATQWQLDYDC